MLIVVEHYLSYERVKSRVKSGRQHGVHMKSKLLHPQHVNVVCRVSANFLTCGFDFLDDRRVNKYKRFVATHTKIVTHMTYVDSPPPPAGNRRHHVL